MLIALAHWIGRTPGAIALKLVITSHIVPWCEDSQNRLNPQNGLCLSALHDRAFDQGLITVLPDFLLRHAQRFGFL